jgi:hypothetical protein
MQCGITSCTISGTSTPGQQACSVTVTFPVAFAAIPKQASATWAGFNSGINHSEKIIPIFTSTFESDNTETWAVFPVATTELYGDVNHEVGISPNELQAATEADFFATCTGQAGAQTGTETLEPQYYDPTLGVWTDLAQFAGSFDLNVGSIFCGVSSSETIFSNIQAINPLASTDGATSLRIVGFGGGGLGDSMTFNEIYLVFYSELLNTPSICIQITSPCPIGTANSGLPISKTQMIICVEIPFPRPTSNFLVNLNWKVSE